MAYFGTKTSHNSNKWRVVPDGQVTAYVIRYANNRRQTITWITVDQDSWSHFTKPRQNDVQSYTVLQNGLQLTEMRLSFKSPFCFGNIFKRAMSSFNPQCVNQRHNQDRAVPIMIKYWSGTSLTNRETLNQYLGFKTWVSNYIHFEQCNVITEPCLKFNDGLAMVWVGYIIPHETGRNPCPYLDKSWIADKGLWFNFQRSLHNKIFLCKNKTLIWPQCLPMVFSGWMDSIFTNCYLYCASVIHFDIFIWTKTSHFEIWSNTSGKNLCFILRKAI